MAKGQCDSLRIKLGRREKVRDKGRERKGKGESERKREWGEGELSKLVYGFCT